MLKNIIPNSFNKKKQKKDKSIIVDEFVEQKSYAFVALVGYVILGLIFFDYLHLLFPPQFFNPNWEIQTIGKIIETIWILLLGFMLVFFRTQQRKIKKSELKILSVLSWLTLAIAICCFLSAPLLMSNALRIDQNNKTQINAQLTNQSSQIEQLFTKINQASNQEINSFLSNRQFAGLSGSDDVLRQQLVDIVQQRKQASQARLQQTLKAKQVKLFKSTFKWVIGAIISGIAFVTVWRYTGWARRVKI